MATAGITEEAIQQRIQDAVAAALAAQAATHRQDMDAQAARLQRPSSSAAASSPASLTASSTCSTFPITQLNTSFPFLFQKYKWLRTKQYSNTDVQYIQQPLQCIIPSSILNRQILKSCTSTGIEEQEVLISSTMSSDVSIDRLTALGGDINISCSSPYSNNSVLESFSMIENDSRTEMFEYADEQEMFISPPKAVSCLSIDTSDDIVDDMNAEDELLFQNTLNELLNSLSPLDISPPRSPQLHISPPRSSDDILVVLSPLIFYR